MTFVSRAVLSLALCSLVLPIYSQTQRGQIIGRVTDASGAVVAGAKIQAFLPQTGLKVDTTTNGDGFYTVASLPYGKYEVTVTSAGFSTYQATGVDVATATATTLEVHLTLGTVAESVNVTGTGVLLQTESPTVSVNVEQKLLQDVPIAVAGNARTAYQFIFLSPTVQTNGFLASGGGRLGTTTLLLDGLPTDGDLSEQDSGVRNEPSVESIGEYKMIVNSPPAEYGRQAGVIMTYSTKSGTNSLHGSAWDYLNNSELNARAWQAASRGSSRSNEFGFAVGGPVFIPKIYDGRNKTFFYTTLAGYRQGATGSATALMTLPTDAMRKGDFSGPGINPLYDVLTQVSDTSGQVRRTPFPNNQIPISRLSKVTANLFPYLPAPNRPGNLLNFVGATSTTYTPWNFSAKGDQYLTTNHRLSGLYTRFTPNQNAGSFLGDQFGRSTFRTAQRTSIEDSFTITPALVNQISFGVSRQSGGTAQNNFGQNLGTKLGLQGLPDGNCPDVRINESRSGAIGLCRGAPASTFGHTVWSLSESLLWNKNRHTIKLGFQMIQFQSNTRALGNLGNDASGASGVFSFGPSSTADTNGQGGDSLASFFLGYPNVAKTASSLILGVRESYYALFIQDDWKISTKLTVNAGLRWDIPVPYSEVHGQMAIVDLAKPNPGATGVNGALSFFGDGPGRLGTNRSGDIHYKNFSPRLGFAYQITPKTVFRGFAGLLYQGITNENSDTADHTGFQAAGSVPPNSDPYGLYYSWDTAFPQNVLGSIPNTNPAFRNGQSVTWNSPSDIGRPSQQYMFSAGFQRQISGNVLIETTYFANLRRFDQDHNPLNTLAPAYRGLGPLLNLPLNSPQVQAAGYSKPFPEFNASLPLYRALVPYPQYVNLDNPAATRTNSTYHAVLLKAEKRFSHGLTFLAHWTISKQLTDTDWSTGSRGSAPRDPYNRRLQKGLERFDTPHRVVLTYSYELPFGPGKKLATGINVVDKYVAGGWTISGVHEYQSGYPVSYGSGGLSVGIPTLGVTPNRVLGVPTRSKLSCGEMRFGDPSRNYLLNAGSPTQAARTGRPSAYSPEGDYQLGNAPLIDPHARQCPGLNENVSLIKQFPVIRDRVHVVLGIDAFNLLNRHRWITYKFGGNFTASDFGEIQPDQPNGPRTLQVRMRVQW